MGKRKKAVEKCIYALVDPRNKMVYYIGASSDPCSRFSEHHNFPGSEEMKMWLQDIRAVTDTGPRLAILEDYTFRHEEAERQWIEGKAWSGLLNIACNPSCQRKKSYKVMTVPITKANYAAMKEKLTHGDWRVSLSWLLSDILNAGIERFIAQGPSFLGHYSNNQNERLKSLDQAEQSEGKLASHDVL